MVRLKRGVRGVLRRLGYDLLKMPPARPPRANRRCRRSIPVWPLPRKSPVLSDAEIRREFPRFDGWHYAYQFEGTCRSRPLTGTLGLTRTSRNGRCSASRTSCRTCWPHWAAAWPGRASSILPATPGSGRCNAHCLAQSSSLRRARGPDRPGPSADAHYQRRTMPRVTSSISPP
jgi:hypothetical protein